MLFYNPGVCMLLAVVSNAGDKDTVRVESIACYGVQTKLLKQKKIAWLIGLIT